MNRMEKQSVVAELTDSLTNASLVVVTQQKGLTVAEITQLRRQMREANAEFRVVKNTLLRLSVKGTPLEPLETLFKGPTAVALSHDPIGAAKVTVKFAEKNTKLAVLGGIMNGQILDEGRVKALASLPSLEELRGKVVGLISAPATKLAVLFKEPATRVARVLSAKES